MKPLVWREESSPANLEVDGEVKRWINLWADSQLGGEDGEPWHWGIWSTRARGRLEYRVLATSHGLLDLTDVFEGGDSIFPTIEAAKAWCQRWERMVSIRAAFKASWARNEEAYRYLGRPC